MDVKNLSYALDITSVAGQTLSAEDVYVIQNALLILQSENHFKHVFFFGKIFGVERDYYLAFGYQSDALTGCPFFYSVNRQEWFLLSKPPPYALKLTPRVSQKFSGDPSYVVDWREAGDTFNISSRECFLKEEDRLAAVTYSIHEECAIAPKGSFFQNIDGLFEMNPTFQGLSLKEVSNAEFWVHTAKKSVVTKGSGDSTDFKNLIEDEWSFRIREQGSVCVLLNLNWLGLVGYHRLRTAEHGFVYFGDGVKSRNMFSSKYKPST